MKLYRSEVTAPALGSIPLLQQPLRNFVFYSSFTTAKKTTGQHGSLPVPAYSLHYSSFKQSFPHRPLCLKSIKTQLVLFNKGLFTESVAIATPRESYPATTDCYYSNHSVIIVNMRFAANCNEKSI